MKAMLIVFVIACVLGGCAGSSGVMPLSGDTYMISRTSAGGAFTNMSSLQANTIKEANAFAAKQGKVAVGISDDVKRPGVGFPSYEYTFKLVDPDSPEAKSPGLLFDGKAVAPKDSDLYTELTRLDDLRKRGLITDEEYETLKKKAIEGKSGTSQH